MSEQVLVIEKRQAPSSVIVADRKGLHRLTDEFYETPAFLVDREQAEQDETLLQLLPYRRVRTKE